MYLFKNLQTYFVAILDQNKKRIKKIEQKLKPVDIAELNFNRN